MYVLGHYLHVVRSTSHRSNVLDGKGHQKTFSLTESICTWWESSTQKNYVHVIYSTIRNGYHQPCCHYHNANIIRIDALDLDLDHLLGMDLL